MKPDLDFRFAADIPGRSIRITREFAANRRMVWDCHTKAELLDRWFAPAPLTTRTSHMDFREGGYWHYAMITPDGTEHWNRVDFKTIEPIERYTTADAFADETGTPNPDMPSAEWDVRFEDAGAHTIVRIVVTYPSEADLQKVIEMGMEQGMAATLQKLDALLEQLDTQDS